MTKAMNTIRQINPPILFGLNALVFVLGITYLYIGKMNIFWNIYGLIMLVTLFGNILFAAKEIKQRRFSILYLVLSTFWMFTVMLINTFVSLNPANKSSQSTISAVMVLSLFFLGGLLSANHVLDKKVEEQPPSIQVEKNKTRTILKYIVIIILSVILYGGLFLAVNLLREQKNGLIEVFLPEYALFYSLAFLSVGTLILKLLGTEKYKLYYSIVFSVTMIMTVIFLIPLASVPFLLKNASKNYMQAFTKEYTTNSDFNSNYFRQLPFFLPEYFYGIPSRGYKLKENVLFCEGMKGVDKDLLLYFDAYIPASGTSELPGGNSVLIRIHGGGWTSGDKGASNFAQMNKYFAAQGYVVFDIQYGLNDLLTWINVLPVPETTSGDYSIDDMVRHIGIFTDYLAQHADEYHVNLRSVFISGGSAGGQLTLASGLALASGKYKDILNPKLNIKGLIPFYPANGLSLEFNIKGEKELVDPSLLVEKNSPPCLIYQGSHDGLVNHEIAEQFRDNYIKAGNQQCAIIKMPYGGHASDFYFSGYYNQVFLYYMERFMYQNK